MGIKGLTSFLDSNTSLLTDFKLRDTKVVVDGNNLFHFLNDLYTIECNCGGDYDCFARAVNSFFGILDQCGVVPAVVFDGPYIPAEKKIGTSVKRAKDRIHLAHQLSLGLRGQATPILCRDVFVSCLDERGVKHVTCEGEADTEIAALANMFGCPVMTNDSDFFIFNIKAGVILLDYLDLTIKHDTEQPTPEQSKEYLNVQIYYCEKLIKYYKLDLERIALFGTMLGNDKVSGGIFSNFFAGETLIASRHVRPKVKRGRIGSVLMWLQHAESLDVALAKILQYYKKEAKQKLKQTIMESVSSYMRLNESHIAISNELVTHVNSDFLSVAGHPMPDWFMTNMHKGRLSTIAANTMSARKVILLAQPENFALKSSHACSKSLRRIIYGILLQYDMKFHDGDHTSKLHCSGVCAGMASEKRLCIEEIDRDKQNQKRSLVEPIFDVGGKAVPSLAEVPDLTENERLTILGLAMGVRSIFSACPVGLELHLLCVYYWVHHVEPRIDVLHLTAVLLCMFKLGALDALSGEEQTDTAGVSLTSDNLESISEKLPSGTLQEFIQCNSSREKINSAKAFLDRFGQPNIKANLKRSAVFLDVNVLHIFAQLQSCMQATQALNEVLGSPLTRIPVAKVFSGTFLIYIYRELRSREKPDHYVFVALGECEVMTAALKAIRKTILDAVDKTDIITDVAPTFRRSKKKKHKPSRKANCTDEEDSDGKDQNDADTEDKLIASCDITNRFDHLLLEAS